MQHRPPDLAHCVYQVAETWTNAPMSHQCARRWKVERDGKGYCKQHDPEAFTARRIASFAKWDAEMEVKQSQWNRKSAEKITCEGVPTGYLHQGLMRKLIDFAYERDNEELIACIEGRNT